MILHRKILIVLIFLISFSLMGLLLNLEKKEQSDKSSNDINSNVKNSQSGGDIAQPLEPPKLSKESAIWIESNNNPVFVPWRDWSVQDPKIEAKSVVLMEIKENSERILFQENIESRLPIASLTKIMTAIVAFENIPLEKIIKIGKETINQEGEAGKLVTGEEISVKNLLYAMLLESSNDAAFALASDFGLENFVNLMNEKSKILKLKNTNFSNPIGMDDQNNFSTSYDFAKLLNYSLENKFLWQILKTSSFETTDVSGRLSHHWENTNKLLGILSNVVGGKTGWTMNAGGCVALVIENPKNNSKIISVLLGAADENKRFEETEMLIDWIFKAYRW